MMWRLQNKYRILPTITVVIVSIFTSEGYTMFRNGVSRTIAQGDCARLFFMSGTMGKGFCPRTRNVSQFLFQKQFGILRYSQIQVNSLVQHNHRSTSTLESSSFEKTEGDLDGKWYYQDEEDDGNVSSNVEDDIEFDADGDIDNDIDGDVDGLDSKNEEPVEQRLHAHLLSIVDKTLKRYTKKESSLLIELQKAQKREQYLHRGNLITANLYQIKPETESLIVTDWNEDGTSMEIELKLDTDAYSSAVEEANDLFSRAKKLKRGSIIVQDLLFSNEKIMEQLNFLRSQINDGFSELDVLLFLKEEMKKSPHIDSSTIEMPSALVKKSGKISNVKQMKASRHYTPTFRELKSPGGVKILVGRNKRDNEMLSFKIAKGDDIWMHARGCPGAHVVLKISRGGPKPTDECFQMAANLAAFYSEARSERKATITLAEPKHIQKPRGAPLGAIKLRKELKSMLGYPEDVPTELKEKREECGFFGENGTRSLGVKSKNKKKHKEERVIRKSKKSEQHVKRKKKSDESNVILSETDFY